MMILEQAGVIARDAVLAAWRRNIVEPRRGRPNEPGRQFIDDIIRTPAGIDWSWQDPFDHDGEFEWCGAGAAFAWGHAGLDLDLRRLYWSSTSRLSAYGAYASHFGTPNEIELRARFPRPKDPGERRVRLVLDQHSTLADLGDVVPRAGDVLLVGVLGGPKFGTHVAMVDEWDAKAKAAHTLEFNARGIFPDGRDTSLKDDGDQGVVKQVRRLGLARGSRGYHIRRLIRPPTHDLTLPTKEIAS